MLNSLCHARFRDIASFIPKFLQIQFKTITNSNTLNNKNINVNCIDSQHNILQWNTNPNMAARLIGNNTHTENSHKELLLGKNEKEEVICIMQLYCRKHLWKCYSKQHRNTEISYFSLASVDLKKQIVVSWT